jgi:hypothetical protein
MMATRPKSDEGEREEKAKGTRKMWFHAVKGGKFAN